MKRPVPDTLACETASAAETAALGARLAALLPGGSVVALRGPLASGKTCFVRGMASSLAVRAHVHSPTFTLVNEYGGSPNLIHVDLYRLFETQEILELGVEELFEPVGICAVEWAERAGILLPGKRVDIFFEHAGADIRRIRIMDHGLLPPDWRQHVKPP